MSPILFVAILGLVVFVTRALVLRHRNSPADPPSIPNVRPRSGERGRRWGIALVSIVYLASFFLPALEFGGKGGSDFNLHPKGVVWGGLAFFLGLGHLFEFGLAWLANPIFCVGMLRTYQGHYRSAALAGIAAALVALIALIQDGPFGRANDKVLNFLPGYWLWLASMVCLTIAALVLLTLSARAKRSKINAEALSKLE